MEENKNENKRTNVKNKFSVFQSEKKTFEKVELLRIKLGFRTEIQIHKT